MLSGEKVPGQGQVHCQGYLVSSSLQEETEAQSGGVVCCTSHSWQWIANWVLNLGLPDSKVGALPHSGQVQQQTLCSRHIGTRQGDGVIVRIRIVISDVY